MQLVVLNDNNVKTLGERLYRYTEDGIEYQDITVEDLLKDYEGLSFDVLEPLRSKLSIIDTTHLMNGSDFAHDVDAGCLIDYDGYVKNVFINGFKTNIRLSHNGISTDRFGVNKYIWNNLCRDNEIYVDWINK